MVEGPGELRRQPGLEGPTTQKETWSQAWYRASIVLSEFAASEAEEGKRLKIRAELLAVHNAKETKLGAQGLPMSSSLGKHPGFQLEPL